MRQFIPNKIKGFRSRSINALIDCAHMQYILPTPTIRREFTTSGVKLNAITQDAGGGESNPYYSFGCPSTTGSTCAVRAGRWCLSGGVYLVAAANVTLSGSAEYVYAWHKKDHSASGFNHASTYPTSAGDQWNVVLATYTSSDAVNWTRTEINHDGDIPFYGPTA